MYVLLKAFAIIICILLLQSCKNGNHQKLTDEQLAKSYCSSCHLFTEPSLLDKATWTEGVLPAMAPNLGLKKYNGAYYVNTTSDIPGNEEKRMHISIEDWTKIIDYYQNNSPEKLPAQPRAAVHNYTELFTLKMPEFISKTTTSFVKIDEGNQWIYVANASDSSLGIYDTQLKQITTNKTGGVIVDMNFKNTLLQPGKRSGLLTTIGILNPNDFKTGRGDSFEINENGLLTYHQTIFDSLPRPVQITAADLDMDGKTDYLVCGFGNKEGSFFWEKNLGHGSFQKMTLLNIPGAIKADINDYNHDGKPDIMVLFAQAMEGIYLFTNKGNGDFDFKDVLRFPPVYGSSYFETADFNHDGFMDILYTCGDNADYSSGELKNFHGVYIFLNDGRNNYRQQYFFPLHGCYKAMARDFDKDGDLDIACISYFPDIKNQPQESFVYLENKGGLRFEPFTIPQYNAGKWLTMDAGDVDGDGDIDIVLGNFPAPVRKTLNKSIEMKNKNVPFILLENTLINNK